MEFQEEISAKQQIEWFNQLDPNSDHYFMINWNKQPVGMAHVNQIDHEAQSAQVGLFMGEKGFAGTGIALSASLLLLEYAFQTLGLIKVWAKVHRDNKVADEYNRQLGFEQQTQGGDFQFMELSKLRFEAVYARLFKLSQTVC